MLPNYPNPASAMVWSDFTGKVGVFGRSHLPYVNNCTIITFQIYNENKSLTEVQTYNQQYQSLRYQYTDYIM